ncbi:hypothetical protein WN55_00352 [Dufourea novaeangliae]|uniref:HCLS1-associated protein X-1 n=1 Tax=Dufourea novaeangliae TaxID=178035 RepID=A0A154PHE4_DUFNO|nr:hypothetical protein WN55_00352 [Dufourea novaeangliae]
MPFWNFIRDVFGGKNSEEPKTSGFFDCRDNCDKNDFRNPIWQDYVDDDDEDDIMKDTHFQVLTDPLQIMKYFELEMDNIVKNFFFGFKTEGQNSFMNALPFTPPEGESLRDKVLKSHDDNSSQVEPKVDVDLDGKITPDNFFNDWHQNTEPTSKTLIPYQNVIGSSISKVFVRKADGTVEQEKIVKDNEGNEERTVSKQIGDKLHIITTRKDKNGVETKTENMVDIDESKLEGNKRLPLILPDSPHNFNWNYFPWEKFFKPDPKL